VAETAEHVEAEEVAVPVAVVANGELEDPRVRGAVGTPQDGRTGRREDGRFGSACGPAATRAHCRYSSATLA
jgi:hypothetical protein